MRERIRDIVAAQGKLSKPIDQLRDGDDLFAAGMTSMASVNVMLDLESQFDIEFPNDLMNRTTFQSVDTIADAIASLGVPVA